MERISCNCSLCNGKSTGGTMRKEFDTVKMMREIQDRLSKKYIENPKKET